MADGFLDARAGLAGRVAAVVGGGFGIGAAVSRALATAGVDLAILDIDATALPATIGDCVQAGRRVTGMSGDATDPVVLERFYGDVERDFERLDIVVNVVGGVRNSPLLDKTRDECAQKIQRNFGYVIESLRQAVPLIRRGRRGGSIVNFTTIEAHRGAAGFAVYAGAKAATANFTRSMAVELGPERIRLNALAPDTTPSRGNEQAMAPEIGAEMAKLPPDIASLSLSMYIPLKAQPTVADIVNGVLFLASDISASVTGTTLHVDGGTMASAGFIDWPYGDGWLPVPMAGTLGRFVENASPG